MSIEPDDNDTRPYGTSPGDLAIIAIALIFSLCGLYLMIGPSPFAALHAAQTAAKSRPAAAPAEVSVGIAPSPPKQP